MMSSDQLGLNPSITLLLFVSTNKIKESQHLLRKWNCEHFGNIHNQICNLYEQINMIQIELPSPSNSATENQLLTELNECLIREELFWHQKSKNQWFTSSNLNTRFFHLSTIIKRRSNAINFIKDDNGN